MVYLTPPNTKYLALISRTVLRLTGFVNRSTLWTRRVKTRDSEQVSLLAIKQENRGTPKQYLHERAALPVFQMLTHPRH